MTTHVELAARLLREAAAFYKSVGKKNEGLHDQMLENAQIFETVAELIEEDPLGEIAD